MIRFPWHKASCAGRSKPHDGEPSSEAPPLGHSDAPASSEEPGVPWAGRVRGERAASIASGARSLQSRMSSLLAAALMISMGIGMLIWYYAEALSRPAAARMRPQASLPQVAGEGMTLPMFGAGISPTSPKLSATVLSAPSAPTLVSLPSSTATPALPAAPLPLEPPLAPPLDPVPEGVPRAYGAPPQALPRETALDRRLSGEVFAGGGSGQGSTATLPARSARAQLLASGSGGDALHTWLRPGVLDTTYAQLLPTRRLLLPKGAFIDCTLETAIDSTLPGMTTCMTATDTFGADGTVVLLERGTKLIGETRGEVRQGEARVFVVWMEARTPSGVVVRLDSPGTDALGRSGLDGTVNRHFWQRFGAAALVSAIDGAVQSEVQPSSRSGTVVLDPTASEDVLNEILHSTVNIAPTVRVRNGARIQVLVARDVDFRPVYELEPR